MRVTLSWSKKNSKILCFFGCRATREPGEKSLSKARITKKISRQSKLPGGLFLKRPGNFSFPKSDSKISNLTIIELLLEVPFMHEVSWVRTSPFLDTDELKMALWARNGSGSFEKRAPGLMNGMRALSPFRHPKLLI